MSQLENTPAQLSANLNGARRFAFTFQVYKAKDGVPESSKLTAVCETNQRRLPVSMVVVMVVNTARLMFMGRRSFNSYKHHRYGPQSDNLLEVFKLPCA